MAAETLKNMWRATVAELKSSEIDSPVADARLLVQYALGISHEDLLLQGDRPLTQEEKSRIAELVARRKLREPVARIVGRRAFWKSEFIVTPDTLDPRQDSETVIEAALAHVQPGKSEQALRLLDLGTGTGCLLLSLLYEWPKATGIGLDISRGAADVAAQNAEALDLASRAEIIPVSWEDYTPQESFDVIVSNPPYIAESERDDLAPEVVHYDPPQALFAAEDGLAAYRSIVARAPHWLVAGGWLILETGYRQAQKVSELVEQAGLKVVEIRRDLGGHQRVVIAQKPLLSVI